VSVLSNGYLLALIPAADPGFDAEFLVIAGGGQITDSSYSDGSTADARGGGGAGGYISSISGESSGGGASALSAVGLTTGVSYSVTVGAAGSSSIFSGTDTSAANFNHTAIAGGGKGATGGSGGGGDMGGGTGGSGTANQGYAGSDGSAGAGDICWQNSSYWCHSACRGNSSPHFGAGGGAGGAASGVNGGVGVQSSVTGTATYYAGGGASKGICIQDQLVGTPGSGYQNYGGGGNLGAAGQDGVVILKYPATVSITSGGGLSMSTSTVSGSRVTVITAGTGSIQFTSV